MLVTGDPVAEIDAALARAAARLRAARAREDTLAVRRLTAWIDYRLDQRLAFDYRCRSAPAQRPSAGSAGGEPRRPRSLRRRR
jgi:hypothetical protein